MSLGRCGRRPRRNAAHRRGDAYLYRRGAETGNPTAVGSEGGVAFERLDDRGIPTGAGSYRAVLAGGREAGEIWAVNDHGLYRTRDAGGSFERVPVDLPSKPARALAIECDE